MKTCKYCGAIVEDGVKFCTTCGAILEDSGDSATYGGNSYGSSDGNYGGSYGGSNYGGNYGGGYGGYQGSHSGGNGPDLGAAADRFKGAVAGAAGSLSNKAGEWRENYQSQQMASQGARPILADGEVEVRTYNVTKVFFPRIDGKLMITNKRVIFYANSLSSKVYQSTPVNSVGTIDTFFGHAWNFGQIFSGIILFIFSFFLFGNNSRRYGGGGGMVFLGILIMALGILLIYLGSRKSLVMNISAVQAGRGIGIGRRGTSGWAFYSIRGVAGLDAGRVMDEIGAMVLDLQQLGDVAIEKWKR